MTARPQVLCLHHLQGFGGRSHVELSWLLQMPPRLRAGVWLGWRAAHRAHVGQGRFSSLCLFWPSCGHFSWRWDPGEAGRFPLLRGCCFLPIARSCLLPATAAQPQALGDFLERPKVGRAGLNPCCYPPCLWQGGKGCVFRSLKESFGPPCCNQFSGVTPQARVPCV